MRTKPYTFGELLEELQGILEEREQLLDFQIAKCLNPNIIIDDTCYLTSEVTEEKDILNLNVLLNIERGNKTIERHDFALYTMANKKANYYELMILAVNLDLALYTIQNNCLEDFVWTGYKMLFLKGNKDLMMLADTKEQIVERYNARREFFSHCTGCKILNYQTRREQIISEENIVNGLLDISQIAV